MRFAELMSAADPEADISTKGLLEAYRLAKSYIGAEPLLIEATEVDAE
jgi:hypothetical protein